MVLPEYYRIPCLLKKAVLPGRPHFYFPEAPDKESLFKYWKCTALYDPNIEDNMKKVIDEEFGESFMNKKIVQGLRCVK